MDMIRDSIGDVAYWDKWVEFGALRTKKMMLALSKPSKNPVYDPQYSFDASVEAIRLIFERYSRGDGIYSLGGEFPCFLDAWELSEKLASRVCVEHGLQTCRDWDFNFTNLNHYNWCFWLVGLALALEIPDDQWQRLLTLIGDEGEDILLDRIIASRQPDRRVGTTLLHPRPYARLLKAINAPKDQQALLLREFVDHWYSELSRKGKDALWWYDYGDPEKHPLEKAVTLDAGALRQWQQSRHLASTTLCVMGTRTIQAIYSTPMVQRLTSLDRKRKRVGYQDCWGGEREVYSPATCFASTAYSGITSDHPLGRDKELSRQVGGLIERLCERPANCERRLNMPQQLASL